ncbi:MAG: hypothetical protein SWX82_13365 [Cyanobacteriota bacterium]|nr:hypothetical protein [Cyanobacteriota bacterium]
MRSVGVWEKLKKMALVIFGFKPQFIGNVYSLSPDYGKYVLTSIPTST